MAQACVMSRPRQEQQLFTPGKQPLTPQLDNNLITSTVRKRKVLPPESPHPAQPAAQLPEEGKRQRTPSVDRGLNDLDGVVRLQLQLASPAAQLKHAAATPVEPPQAGMEGEPEAKAGECAQQPGPWQHPQQHLHQQHEGRRAPSQAGGEGEEEELLFSPVFHLCREGSRDDLSAAGAAALAAAAGASTHLAPAPAAAAQQHSDGDGSSGRAETDNASTDQSTGTSACLAEDADVSDADEASAEADGELNSCGGGGSPLAAVATQAPPPSPACRGDDDVEDSTAAAVDEYLEFDPLLFIKRLPPLERCVPPRREFLLPKKTRRSKLKTLVLDLDETLVHSTLDGYCRPDFTFPVEVGSMTHMVSVRQRPHLHTFLERVAQLYEVVVFTASQRVYAEQLLNIVDPQRRLVRHRVYRESCVFWEGNYLKDLTVLGRDLAHTIIVDNSPQAFGFQIDNGIPIESWYDDDRDEELLKLIPFLEKVAHVDDVRPHIQKRYRLRRLVEAAADPEQCLLHQQPSVLLPQQQHQQQELQPAGQAS